MDPDFFGFEGSTRLGPPLNRKYLRAIHEYHPSDRASTDANADGAKTVELHVGDLVLVHLTHSNGWADGTVLNTGVRGWLPANYCRPFDHEYIRNIFHALTKLWKCCASGSVATARSQEASQHVQAIVSGVRYLLERTGCPRRTDPLVKHNSAVHHTRSSLLSDLSAFVSHGDQMALEAVTVLSSRRAGEEEHIFKAFMVACRAVKFLDVWKASMSLSGGRTSILHNGHPGTIYGQQISTHTPNASTAQGSGDRNRQLGLSKARLEAPPRNVELPWNISIGPESEVRSSMIEPHGAANFAVGGAVVDIAATGLLMESIDFKNDNYTDQRHAYELLNIKHRVFLELMGSLTSLLIQSCPPAELCEIANLTFEACDAVLAVLYSIQGTIDEQSPAFISSVAVLGDKSNALSTMISGLKTTACSDPEPIRYRSLINDATACIRYAEDCASQARHILQSRGDFSIDVGKVVSQITLPLEPLEDHRAGNSNPPIPPAQMRPTIFPVRSHSLIYNSPMAQHTSDMTRTNSPSSTENSLYVQKASPAIEQTSIVPQQDDVATNYNKTQVNDTPDITPDSDIGAQSGCQEDMETGDSSEASVTSTRATSPDLPVLVTGPPGTGPTPVTPWTAPEFPSRGVPQQLTPVEHPAASLTVYNQDNRCIGGTLAGMVEHMTGQVEVPDPNFIKVFLTTFRCFATAAELVDAIIARYGATGGNGEYNTPGRVRVQNLIRQWLDFYWDFDADMPALKSLQHYAKDPQLHILPSSRQRLLESIKKASTNISTAPSLLAPLDVNDPLERARRGQEIPTPIFNKTQQALLSKYWVEKVTVLEFDAVEIARQLTLLNCRLLCQVRPMELLISALAKVESKAPRVLAISRRSTGTANLVTETILLWHDAKKRAAIIKQWILIAHELGILQNYDTLMAIMCALQSTTISRLKLSWSILSKKTLAIFEDLVRIIEPTRNYAALRQRLSDAHPPCLPFVGLYLTDLTFIDAGNPDSRTVTSKSGQPVKVINFDKWTRATKTIDGFQRFQVPYHLQAVPQIQDWLLEELERVRKLETTDDSMYQRSLQLEPRENTSISKSNKNNDSQESLVAPLLKFGVIDDADLKKPTMPKRKAVLTRKKSLRFGFGNRSS